MKDISPNAAAMAIATKDEAVTRFLSNYVTDEELAEVILQSVNYDNQSAFYRFYERLTSAIVLAAIKSENLEMFITVVDAVKLTDDQKQYLLSWLNRQAVGVFESEKARAAVCAKMKAYLEQT